MAVDSFRLMYVAACQIRLILFFFFSSRRRHTRSLRDWSSDVCSSDLPITAKSAGRATLVAQLTGPGVDVDQTYGLEVLPANPMVTRRIVKEIAPNGGADRKSVV